MRHTFISRLAENPSVSEQTIKALAGQVSRQMLERYRHIRFEAKQAAIQALECASIGPILPEIGHKFGHTGATVDEGAEAKWLSQHINGAWFGWHAFRRGLGKRLNEAGLMIPRFKAY